MDDSCGDSNLLIAKVLHWQMYRCQINLQFHFVSWNKWANADFRYKWLWVWKIYIFIEDKLFSFFWHTKTNISTKIHYPYQIYAFVSIAIICNYALIIIIVLLLQYWIKHVTIGLLSVKFISTRIFCKGEESGVFSWLRFVVPWINHSSPVYWSTIWKLVLNDIYRVSLI